MPDEALESLDREKRLDEAVTAFLEAQESGRRPHRQEWLDRYPEVAAELEKYFADQDEVDRLTSPLRAAIQGTPPPGDTPQPGRPNDASSAVSPSALVSPPEGYELLQVLGQGGMGVVYKARQKGADRLVALKLIRADRLTSDADVQRFRNEAEAAAQLDHPHIVPVYEVGARTGHFFFSMKLNEGGGLDEQLDRFRDDPQKAARLVAQVARAVHHAHQRGILHRDLKPSNILLDREGQPHVSDFGLAKRIEADASLTQTGAIVGTPQYMAPEQTRSQKGTVTTATDVYGLGAVLYALLTGQPPFQDETVLETLEQVRKREPEPPRRSNPKVDRDLETICLKCLEKEPGQRYGSAEALAEELESWLRGEPIAARPVGRLDRLWRWCRRNPVLAVLTCALVGTLVLLIIGLVVGSIVIWHQKVRADEAYKSEAEQRRRADEKRRWARKAVNDMYTGVAENWLAHEPRMTEIQKQFLRRALEFYKELAAEESANPDERLERAVAFRRMADIRGGGFHRAEGAENNYRQAVMLCEELADEFPDNDAYQAELVRSREKLGRFLGDNHRSVEAEPFLLRARIVAEGLANKSPNDPQDRETLAECETSLGVLWSATDLQKAEAALSRALTIRQELARAYPEVGDYREKLAFAHLALGEVHRTRGRLKETEQAFKQAALLLEARRKEAALPPWLVNTVGGGGYHGLAEALLDQRRPSEAEKAIRRSVEIRKQVDRDFPGMPYCWHGLAMSLSTQGRILRELGRHREAVAVYREAVEYQQRALADNPEHASLRQDMGVMRSELAWLMILGPPPLRDTDQAATQIQRALELEAENDAYLTVRAIVEYRRGEWTKSLQALRAALRDNDANDQLLRGWVSVDGAMQRMAERQARAAVVLNGFFTAMCLYRLGKKDEARECYLRASQQRQAQKIDEPAHVAELQAIQREAAVLLDIQE